MNIKKIYIRTHGGLGNQLFQFFYAKLISSKSHNASLLINHNEKYKHGFKLVEELSQYSVTKKSDECSLLGMSVSNSRLAKVYEKIRINHGRFQIGSTLYLDGYFQNPSDYLHYSSSEIRIARDELASIMNIDEKKTSGNLYHIRLADFFKNDDDRESEIIRVLNAIEPNSDVITSDDRLLLKKVFQDVLRKKKCKHIVSASMNASDLVRLMSKASSIHSNNSTLAFWASVLSGSDLVVSSPKLKELSLMLRSR